MMNILMVTMSMNIGGAETHILELCRELLRRGCRITLASFGGVYAEEAERAGVRCVKLPLHTKRPAEVLESYRGLKKLIGSERFDVIHAHARIPAFLCGLLWDRFTYPDGTKFRFVTTAHLNFSVNPLWRLISRWGERTMAVSDDIADYLVREYGVPRNVISTTINGIDTVKFSPEVSPEPVLAAHGLDPAARHIVYMSRMDADRADPAFRLVHIAERLAAAFPDTDLLLVGGGDQLELLRTEADAANRKIGRSYITVTGAVSNTNEYCAAATVFVGVSRSLLEAMACAKPVILAGNQGALGIFDESRIPAAVDTNFCCRGFPRAEEDALLRDLSALLNRPADELAGMGAFNRRFIEERYTAARMADDYLELYRDVLSSPVPYRGAPDITLSGYYGYGNLGDESLLDVITASLAETIPGVKLAVLAHDPKAEFRRTGVRCVNRFHLLAAGRTIRQSKVLLSGGGSLLQDATSRRSLRYYAEILRFAQKSGVKTVVYANGIGPIRDARNRVLTRRVIEGADAVSTRDEESARELERLGVTREVRVTADPTYRMQPMREDRLEVVKRRLGLGGKPYFVVSVRRMPDSTDGGDEQIAEEVTAAARSIANRYGMTPVILPMQATQDSGICEGIQQSLTGEGAVLYRPETAGELLGMLGGAAFVIGMRLHAIIFASSAGVPVIGLSYDPKISSILAELGQPYMVPKEQLTSCRGAIERYADDVIAHADTIRCALTERAAELRDRCSDDLARMAELLR